MPFSPPPGPLSSPKSRQAPPARLLIVGLIAFLLFTLPILLAFSLQGVRGSFLSAPLPFPDFSGRVLTQTSGSTSLSYAMSPLAPQGFYFELKVSPMGAPSCALAGIAKMQPDGSALYRESDDPLQEPSCQFSFSLSPEKDALLLQPSKDEKTSCAHLCTPPLPIIVLLKDRLQASPLPLNFTHSADFGVAYDALGWAAPPTYRDTRWPNGALRDHEPFVRGVRHGLARYTWDNGALYGEIPWYRGNKHGIFKLYRADGTLEQELSYRNGVVNGLCRWYDERGNLTNMAAYRDGQPLRR